MATPKSQRIGIWVIASVLMIGTIGSFAVMILQSQNAQTDQQQQQKLIEEYQKQLADQQKQADELSSQYYAEFSQYKDVPAAFDMNAVGDKVTTNDLKPGTGAEIKSDTKYKAYYIGWNPKGKVFDSSISDQKLKAPIDTATTTLIEGWSQGTVGMKVGGVREITIPSDLAYKDQGSGDDIPPNTPIKFVVMVIATN
ncbi:MAG TPA: FKBP-type peptidyl-prolyl cis-trans isomerase [Candidatus Saccharimonadales bacterium]|nr:FKBP-type peptidyl-prolyl cis-trans isomerase [Candidatus Saccharimonadales bacterium]